MSIPDDAAPMTLPSGSLQELPAGSAAATRSHGLRHDELHPATTIANTGGR